MGHVYSVIQIGGRNKDKVAILGGNFDHPSIQSPARDILSPSPIGSLPAKDKLGKPGFLAEVGPFRALTGVPVSLLF